MSSALYWQVDFVFDKRCTGTVVMVKADEYLTTRDVAIFRRQHSRVVRWTLRGSRPHGNTRGDYGEWMKSSNGTFLFARSTDIYTAGGGGGSAAAAATPHSAFGWLNMVWTRPDGYYAIGIVADVETVGRDMNEVTEISCGNVCTVRQVVRWCLVFNCTINVK